MPVIKVTSGVPPEHFDALARAIGHICIIWATVELDINELLRLMIPLDNGPEGRIVTANTDLRDKIQIVKALGFAKQPSEQWHNKLTNELDKIDNEYRNKRNRYVHDVVAIDSQNLSLHRVRDCSKVVKPQSHKPRELVTWESTPATEHDVLDFYRELSDCKGRLLLITLEFQGLLPQPPSP